MFRINRAIIELIHLSCDRWPIELMLQVVIQVVLHRGWIQVQRLIQLAELILGEHVSGWEHLISFDWRRDRTTGVVVGDASIEHAISYDW